MELPFKGPKEKPQTMAEYGVTLPPFRAGVIQNASA